MIQVSAPSITGLESTYVNQALEEGWVSSTGRFVDAFEKDFAAYLGMSNAVTCSSGTTGLHLALLALGIGPGDEVIVPSLSFIATANAVMYTGATPVMVDVDAQTWGVSLETIELAKTARTKAIIVVHLYGLPAHIRPILQFARLHGIAVVEDAAEGLGGNYEGTPCGTLADVGVFSFYGNKVLTTGEGGMVVTNDSGLAERVRHLRGQGQDPTKRYFHTVLGYNYRLTNMQAAIGLAQLQRIEEILDQRNRLFSVYTNELTVRDVPVDIPKPGKGSAQAPWLYTVLLRDCDSENRGAVMESLAAKGIETRPIFYVGYEMPPYYGARRVPDRHINAETISAAGLSLPTHLRVTEDEIDYIVSAVAQALG